MQHRAKTVGQPSDKETQWVRFRRLQRTAAKVMGGLPYPRGIQRFRSVEESDAWQMNHRLNRPARPKTAI